MWTAKIKAVARRFLQSSHKPACSFSYAVKAKPQLSNPPMRSVASSSFICRGLAVSRRVPALLRWASDLQSCNFTTTPAVGENVEDPVDANNSSLLDEKEYHKLADEVLDYLHEKIEELGEELEIDGFDTDHAEGVLTIRLGTSGTYVINKQTPNKQIWLSSPVSGPARFDWDGKKHCWVYRRTKAELLRLLQKELNELLGPSSLRRYQPKDLTSTEG